MVEQAMIEAVLVLMWLRLIISLCLTPFKKGATFGDFGGSSPSGTTTVTQNRDPWSGQQPYISTGFQRAEQQLDQPQQFFPNSTVVPFSPQTETALGAQENRALLGNPLNAQAQQQIGNTLSGQYLEGGNPAFGAMAQRIENQVRPRIDSQFSGAGRYGSGAHREATSRALADAMAPLAFANYQQERGNQMAAARYAPELAATDYFDINQLRQAGAAREGQAGAELQDTISRFNFGQVEPQERLARYMALVSGGQFGGTSTATSPIYSNPLSTGLGTLGSAASIGNLFGFWGN